MYTNTQIQVKALHLLAFSLCFCFIRKFCFVCCVAYFMKMSLCTPLASFPLSLTSSFRFCVCFAESNISLLCLYTLHHTISVVIVYCWESYSIPYNIENRILRVHMNTKFSFELIVCLVGWLFALSFSLKYFLE